MARTRRTGLRRTKRSSPTGPNWFVIGLVGVGAVGAVVGYFELQKFFRSIIT